MTLVNRLHTRLYHARVAWDGFGAGLVALASQERALRLDADKGTNVPGRIYPHQT